MIKVLEKKLSFKMSYVKGTTIYRSLKNKNLFYDLLKAKEEVLNIKYFEDCKEYDITFKGDLTDEECVNIIKEIESIVGYRKSPIVEKDNYEENDWFLIGRDRTSRGIYGYYLKNALTKKEKYISRENVAIFFEKNNCINGVIQPSRNLIISKSGEIPKR